MLYLVVACIVARGTLRAATTPTAHTFEEARKFQIEQEGVDFADYDLSWRKRDFEVDGVHGKVRGEFIYNEAVSSPAKVVVICHGHSWNRLTSVKYARIFYSLGYNVVLYDHAYFGKSDGEYTTVGYYERQDLSKVLDAVRAEFGSDAFVGLHGESMGAATVLCELALRGDIDFVIADCGFSDAMSYYRELCLHLTHLPGFPIVDISNAMAKRKMGYDFRKVKPIDAVAASNVPICFIHGSADKFILPKHSERMYKVSANPLSELHIVEGAGHARSHKQDSARYKQIVTEFVAKVEHAGSTATVAEHSTNVACAAE